MLKDTFGQHDICIRNWNFTQIVNAFMNFAKPSLLIVFLVLTSISTVFSQAGKSANGIVGKPAWTDTATARKTAATVRGINGNIYEGRGSYKAPHDAGIQYRMLSPEHNDANKKYPLVLVFHGSGVSGNDNNQHLGIMAKLWAQPNIRNKYPAYVVAPQFPDRSSNYEMDSNLHVLVSVPQPGIQSVLKLVDSLKKSLNIDEHRIYAVGFSMGGSTVINVLTARPDLFAAGVSVSGIPQFKNVNALANIPLWLIHGNSDTENPIDSDKLFFKSANKKHNTLFWIVEDTDHMGILSPMILGEAIPEWLFGKRKV